jgi:hypothetical protein
VRTIRKIARTQDPDAIAILGSLLDSPGLIGAAAVLGLYSFGQFAASEMRRLVAESMDEDQIRNAHRVLARLGDRYSRKAQHAVCWADLEERQVAENTRAEEKSEPIANFLPAKRPDATST